MENQSKRTQEFFSNVVAGTEGQHKPIKKYIPFEDFRPSQVMHLLPVARTFARYAGDFDNHIACSIPTFRECQLTKAWAIAAALPEMGNILDIGGSEGTLIKTIGRMVPDSLAINLEPNKDMLESFNKWKPENCYGIRQAFLESFDNLPVFNSYAPRLYDIINETMTFQFIKKDRVAFLDEVKRFLKPNGIFFTEEKFQSANKVLYSAAENMKDKRHKVKYFTPEQITAKTEQVLVGMSELQADHQEYYSLLQSKFKHVRMYWKSGNFRGYMCSDDLDTITMYDKLFGQHLILHAYAQI